MNFVNDWLMYIILNLGIDSFNEFVKYVEIYLVISCFFGMYGIFLIIYRLLLLYLYRNGCVV